jgi:dihydrolipoamide dehydrogenase
MAETQGFVKLIARDQRLVGAGVVGPEASELIAELTLALEVGASLEDLALTVHSHPTLAEAVHEAAEQGLGQSVHILNRKRRAAHAAPLAPATP